VISHAGTGSILTALQLGKRPIVVPRRAAHGEHVDGHQDDLAAFVASEGLALVREADEITLADLRESLQWRVTSVGDPEPVQLA
jgi:UDP-N-acetylglucosamine--N-acetylmuramyl-(pentapeptide) pyrophosphoryl-undecaprenol N-acetylglucosamine transferase